MLPFFRAGDAKGQTVAISVRKISLYDSVSSRGAFVYRSL